MVIRYMKTQSNLNLSFHFNQYHQIDETDFKYHKFINIKVNDSICNDLFYFFLQRMLLINNFLAQRDMDILFRNCLDERSFRPKKKRRRAGLVFASRGERSMEHNQKEYGRTNAFTGMLLTSCEDTQQKKKMSRTQRGRVEGGGGVGDIFTNRADNGNMISDKEKKKTRTERDA